MNKSIKEQLEILWCEDEWTPASYFMKKMTQEEFSQRTKKHESVPYEFNKIKEPVKKLTEPAFKASNDINPTQDGLKTNEGLKRK